MDVPGKQQRSSEALESDIMIQPGPLMDIFGAENSRDSQSAGEKQHPDQSSRNLTTTARGT